ncbi:MAG: AsmA family protein [Candidatus Binatia bacterium]
MKVRRWLALAAAGGTVMGIGLAVAGAVVRHGGPQVVAAAGHALGRELEADAVGLRLRGGLGVELQNVRIADDPAFGGGEPLLTARRLALQVRLLPLLARRIIVSRVTMESPIVHVIRRADGRLNIESLRPAPPRTAARQLATMGAAVAAPAFAVDHLRIRDGTVHYAELGDGRALTVSGLDAEVDRSRRPGVLAVRGRAAVEGGGVVLAAIEVDGTVAHGAEPPMFSGTVGAGPGNLPVGRRALSIQRVTIAGDQLTQTAPLPIELDGALAGQGTRIERLHAKGTVEIGGRRPIFRGTVEGGPGTFGTVAVARVEAEVTMRGDPAARFTLDEGRVPGAGLGPGALGPFEPLLGSGPAGRLRERFPDLLGGEGLAFTRCTGVAQLGADRVRLSDLVVTAPSYTLEGGGTVGHAGELDLAVRLTLGRALGDELLAARPALRAAIAATDGTVTVPLHVHGQGAHPHLTPAPEFVGRAAAGLAQERGVEGVVGGLLNQFLGSRKKK